MKGRENKPHIGIFGRRNNGKSSLINALTKQPVAIVSENAGTTTDPVKKSIEIFGIGPVILIDTAGIDDVGELGKQRVAKSLETIKIVDLALILITNYEWGKYENQLVEQLNQYDTPFLVVNNKIDRLTHCIDVLPNQTKVINVSAQTGAGIDELIDTMKAAIPESAYMAHALLSGIVSNGDTVLLITPIDSEAPEGRMILPQVQAIRDALDHDAIVIILKEDKVSTYLESFPSPKIVITDSQVFPQVSPLIPEELPLTSFSILLAHYKGDFEHYLSGTPSINSLKDGDSILMLESCTHLTSCEDIGRVKIPRLLQKYTGKKLNFTFVSGLSQLPDIDKYAMVVQCGGCMMTRKQLINRLKPAIEKNIPVTNYGMLLAFINGIFERATRIFQSK